MNRKCVYFKDIVDHMVHGRRYWIDYSGYVVRFVDRKLIDGTYGKVAGYSSFGTYKYGWEKGLEIRFREEDK